MLWVFDATFVLRLSDRLRPGLFPNVPTTTTPAVVGWAGLREVVSLATALALLRLTDAGEPFPYREVIIFLIFLAAVIMVTLIGQGLTLGPLVRWLGFDADPSLNTKLWHARRAATLAAPQTLDQLSGEDWVPAGPHKLLRAQYERRLARLPNSVPSGTGEAPAPGRRAENRLAAQTRLITRVPDAERQARIELRNTDEINDEVLRHPSAELDQAALRPIA